MRNFGGPRAGGALKMGGGCTATGCAGRFLGGPMLASAPAKGKGKALRRPFRGYPVFAPAFALICRAGLPAPSVHNASLRRQAQRRQRAER